MMNGRCATAVHVEQLTLLACRVGLKLQHRMMTRRLAVRMVTVNQLQLPTCGACCLCVHVLLWCRMYAGPSDVEPKALVDELIRDTGFVPTYLGPIRYARNLEVG